MEERSRRRCGAYCSFDHDGALFVHLRKTVVVDIELCK